MDDKALLLIIVGLQSFVQYGDLACTLPAELDGTWYDSEFNAAITIDNANLGVSGWSYVVFTSTASSFTCVDSDSSLWVFRSASTVHAYGSNYYAVKCIQYTKVTDYSYQFYLKSDEEENASHKRLKFVSQSDYDAGVSISDMCSPSTGPGAEEFHVLVKSGNVPDVGQTFPNALLGQYAYSVNDGSSTYCGTGSVWDDCTNNTIMSLNYTQCITQMFGSSSGVLYAVYSVTSGSTTYVILINNDSPTSSRFTCLAVSGLSASSNPGSCVKQQSATTRTSNSASVLITLTAYKLCPLTTDAAESSNVGTVVAVVIVLLLLVAAGIAVGYILYYKRKHLRFPWQKKPIENNNNDDNKDNIENSEKPEIVIEDTKADKKVKKVITSHK